MARKVTPTESGHETMTDRIADAAERILRTRRGGLRHSDLAEKVQGLVPDASPPMVKSMISNLVNKWPKRFDKPERGLYRLSQETKGTAKRRVQHESSLYAAFAGWLEAEDECTKAIPLGGSAFGPKWGTPDVIGVYQPRALDVIKSSTEVVAAEIKKSNQKPIEAFGQACAYKLFSHRSWIVMPDSGDEEEVSRLESLCLKFGVGLVLYMPKPDGEPEFQVPRVRPTKTEPDMYYVNKYLKPVADKLL